MDAKSHFRVFALPFGFRLNSHPPLYFILALCCRLVSILAFFRVKDKRRADIR
jgi:hypothetical protein